jgi:hypothetical protein
MTSNLVIGRYELDHNRGVLHIAGSGLERNIIEELPTAKYTYYPADKKNEICGRATFIVDSESEAEEIVKMVGPLLKKENLIFSYKGRTAVDKSKLEKLENEKELHKLVYTTIAQESMKITNSDNLTTIDYIAEINRLRKNK